MGVYARCECVDLGGDGNAQKIPQDDSKATDESCGRKADAQIDWSKPVDEVYNLIRGTNPQPGAWTTFKGNELKIFDSRNVAGDVAPATVLAVEGVSFTVAAKVRAIPIDLVRPPDAHTISPRHFAAHLSDYLPVVTQFVLPFTSRSSPSPSN